MRKLSEGQQNKVVKAIEQHHSFRNAWFWSPPTNASGRRWMEKKHNWCVEFKHEGVAYAYVSSVRYSTRNVYYQGYFQADEKKVTVRRFKALLGKS